MCWWFWSAPSEWCCYLLLLNLTVVLVHKELIPSFLPSVVIVLSETTLTNVLVRIEMLGALALDSPCVAINPRWCCFLLKRLFRSLCSAATPRVLPAARPHLSTRSCSPGLSLSLRTSGLLLRNALLLTLMSAVPGCTILYKECWGVLPINISTAAFT